MEIDIKYKKVDVGTAYHAFGGDLSGLSRGEIAAAVSLRALLNGGIFRGQ